MKIIMPMAGEGRRFRQEGYASIKPLIPVGGRTMVEIACDAFPANEEFIFICNRDHLKMTGLERVLRRIRPDCRIFAVEPHSLGPVHSVLQVQKHIPDEEEVILNYCDFTMEWDYGAFLRSMRETKADAGLAVFRGFQPAQFTGTRYAYVRQEGMRLLEIREKESYTDNRLAEYASTGTHYFRSGALMKKYLQQAVDRDMSTRNEFYASLPFNAIVQDGLRVQLFEVQKFICLGTPNDVKEYEFWHDYFRKGAGRTKLGTGNRGPGTRNGRPGTGNQGPARPGEAGRNGRRKG